MLFFRDHNRALQIEARGIDRLCGCLHSEIRWYFCVPLQQKVSEILSGPRPDDQFCETGKCSSVLGDMAVMADSTHVSGGVWVRLRDVLLLPIEEAIESS